jgi:hypothetical protein
MAGKRPFRKAGSTKIFKDSEMIHAIKQDIEFTADNIQQIKFDLETEMMFLEELVQDLRAELSKPKRPKDLPGGFSKAQIAKFMAAKKPKGKKASPKRSR